MEIYLSVDPRNPANERFQGTVSGYPLAASRILAIPLISIPKVA